MKTDNNKYPGVDKSGNQSTDSQVEFTRIVRENGDFFRFQSIVIPECNLLVYISGDTGAVMALAADVGRCVGCDKVPMKRAEKELGSDEWRRTHIPGIQGTPPTYVSLASSVDLIRWMLEKVRNLAMSQFSVVAYKVFVKTVRDTCAAIAGGAYEFGFNPVMSGERPYAKPEVQQGSSSDYKTSKEAIAEAEAMTAADAAKRLRKAMELDGEVFTSADMASWLTSESKVRITPEMVENTLNEKTNGIPAYIMPFVDTIATYLRAKEQPSDEDACATAPEPEPEPAPESETSVNTAAGAPAVDDYGKEYVPSALTGDEDIDELYRRLGRCITLRQMATAHAESICLVLGIKAPW